MTFIVGLTGGIGSGKSAVAALFRRLGIKVVDADIAGRKVVEPGMPALAAIAAHFGQSLLLANGSLNRAALREIVFKNSDERQWLEQLLHPEIADWIVRELDSASSPYAILESPLLLETTQHQLVDHTLVVDVTEEMQVARASARDGNTPEQIKAIMATQLPRQARQAKADDLIDNSGSLTDLAGPVQALHEKFLGLAATKLASTGS